MDTSRSPEQMHRSDRTCFAERLPVHRAIVYHSPVIKRLYVHNFKCLQNFELPMSGHSSVLLIGKNGAGKTTVGLALEVLQKIARGTNRVGELVEPQQMFQGHTDEPLRFEIEVELGGRTYAYGVAFELPEGFKELRVLQENLTIDRSPVYTRESALVHITKESQEREAQFRIDWHLVALPIVQERSTKDPLFVFKQWLARLLVLRPVPGLIQGESKHETLQPNVDVTDFAAWFAGLLAEAPSAYAKVDEYLREVMPDFRDIKNPPVGRDSRNLVVQFAEGQRSMTLPFEDLSDGEKAFMICALVLAANDSYGPLACFWDEPDSYLAPSEVGHFVLALRRAFQSGGQFIATSHNTEAISRFSNENTFVLYRKSHLEPTIARLLDTMDMHGNLIDALVRGDVEP